MSTYSCVSAARYCVSTSRSLRFLPRSRWPTGQQPSGQTGAALVRIRNVLTGRALLWRKVPKCALVPISGVRPTSVNLAPLHSVLSRLLKPWRGVPYVKFGRAIGLICFAEQFVFHCPKRKKCCAFARVLSEPCEPILNRLSLETTPNQHAALLFLRRR